MTQYRVVTIIGLITILAAIISVQFLVCRPISVFKRVVLGFACLASAFSFGNKKRETAVTEALEYIKEVNDPPGFRVENFREKGRGVVTEVKRYRGEFLLVYKGEIINGCEGDSREENLSTGYRFFYKSNGKYLCVDASVEDNSLGRLVNHGKRKEQNCAMKEVKGHLCLFATSAMSNDIIVKSAAAHEVILEVNMFGEVFLVRSLQEGADIRLLKNKEEFIIGNRTFKWKYYSQEIDDTPCISTSMAEPPSYEEQEAFTKIDDTPCISTSMAEPPSHEEQEAFTKMDDTPCISTSMAEPPSYEEQEAFTKIDDTPCISTSMAEPPSHEEQEAFTKIDDTPCISTSLAEAPSLEELEAFTKIDDTPCISTSMAEPPSHEEQEAYTNDGSESKNDSMDDLDSDSNNETLDDSVKDPDFILNSSKSDDDETYKDIPDSTKRKRVSLSSLNEAKPPKSKKEIQHDKEDVTSGITVQAANNAHGRKWDKKEYCLFCSMVSTNITKHLLKSYKIEVDIKKILDLPLKSKERNQEIMRVRRAGNYKHNVEVMKKGNGEIVVVARHSNETKPQDYLPCESCLGFFLKESLWRHKQICPFSKKGHKTRKVEAEASLLLPDSIEVHEGLKANVISKMTPDEVTIACRNDKVILKVGEKLYHKHGHMPHLRQHVSQKVRELGRFLICARKHDLDIKCLSDILVPEKFPLAVTSTKILCKYDNVENHFGNPSLALNLGHLLKKCAKLSKYEALVNSDTEQGRKADGFLTLCEDQWTDEISTSALNTLTTKRMNKGETLPLSKDIVNLQKYFDKKTKTLTETLEERFSKLDFDLLNQIILAELVLFNRRRGGETQRLKVKAYMSRMEHSECPPSEVMESLSATEKCLLKTLSRVEIRGKKGRSVPVLLPCKLIRNIDLLLKWRQEAGMAEDNEYVFARPNFGSLEPIRSSDVLRYFAKEAGLVNPCHITSTKLRKHVATVAQVLKLDKNDLETMASFMGHDITVHRSFYRLPQEILQVARMGRLLTAFNNGSIGKYSGKCIDDISLDQDGELSSDNSSESDGDDVAKTMQNQDYEHEAQRSSMEGKQSKRNSSSANFDYTIDVRTGDRPKAGTNANVYCILKGEGEKSKKTKLDVWFHDDFERGQLDKFLLKKQSFANVDSIEIWRDTTGISDDWNIDTIMVINETTKVKTVFPVFRWIRANYHYVFIPLDTCLPQYDERKEQRQKELEEKQQEYQLEQKAPGLPPQAKNLPRDEQFSFDYVWDITKMADKLIRTSKLVQRTTGKWNSIDDIRKVYTNQVFTEPINTRRWEDDVAFGLQRIAGVNNSFIRLCKEIPEKLGVTDEMLEPFLEGLTLPVAISERRIFIVDHDLLQDCPTAKDAVTAAPIGLFFRKIDDNLVPIAIQLQQEKADDNPVFLPSDPKYTWIMAKMWFNNADTGMHQAIAHLGFTHLVMEGVTIVTHRNISQSHPLFKLLAPHFLYLMAINARALDTLLAPDGWVDKTMTVAAVGLLELIKRQKPYWRMNVEGTLPEDLKERGLDDIDILPNYPFREDALLLYDCIKTYVSNYVKIYYETDDVVVQDQEIQNWRAEMVKPDNEGGLGIVGVAGEDGKFTNREQLAEVLTSIIYTCSVAHAAANFKQYDEYAFPPNYPSKMAGNLPKTKAPLTEKDLVDSLPDIPTTLNTMIITEILSQRGTKPLGDFEVNYIFDPKGLEVVKEFRANLKKASETVQRRNQYRDPPYPYLDPAEVPNAISI